MSNQKPANKKFPEPDLPGESSSFIGEFYQKFRELIPVILKIFQKICKRRKHFTLNLLMYQHFHTHYANSKSQTKAFEENYRPIFLMNVDVEIHNKILENLFQFF